MSMRILVTGANGFIGSAVCGAALQAGHEVHGTVRASSTLDLLDDRVVRHTADLADEGSVKAAVATARPAAVVHCAAIAPLGRPDRERSEQVNVRGTAFVVAAAKECGCRRFIHVSSMSAQPDNQAVYGSTKRRSEEPVRESGLDWTILRPSLVYGNDPRSVFGKMVSVLRKAPFIPVIGAGREPVRPVHVDDVASAVIAVLAEPKTYSKTYCLGGKDAMDVNTMLRTTAEALGKRPLLVHVPLGVAKVLASVLAMVLANPPVTRDNIEGVEKAAACEIDDAVRDFGYAPRSYAEGLAQCDL